MHSTFAGLVVLGPQRPPTKCTRRHKIDLYHLTLDHVDWPGISFRARHASRTSGMTYSFPRGDRLIQQNHFDTTCLLQVPGTNSLRADVSSSSIHEVRVS